MFPLQLINIDSSEIIFLFKYYRNFQKLSSF